MLLATLQEASGSYKLAFQVFLGIALCAFALSFAVNKPKRREQLRITLSCVREGHTDTVALTTCGLREFLSLLDSVERHD